ncbi:MAG TPA: hypothetical protein HA230_05310 [Candidatus Aenigmarchaeota archaeon]|nr:hypothetical protein [Candidatus Aenigmarchaeota archaeon]
MNHEKYPNYFLAVIVLYGVVFLAGFGYFIAPMLSSSLIYMDFVVITVLFLLPLPLLAVYEKMSRFHFLWGKEKFIRILITALTLIDFVTVFYLMTLLM